MVLVCMVVSTTILVGVAASSLRARRQMQMELQMEQTRWLLQASVLRAREQCLDSEEYDGETLNISPPVSQRQSTTVVIEVTKSTAEQADVSVTAIIIGDGPAGKPTQRSERFTVLR
jgi:hypothetical protein